MANQQQTLIGFQKAEFEKAAKLQLLVVVLQFMITIITGVVVFLHDDSEIYILGLASVVLAVGWALAANNLRKVRGCAERARRVAVLVDAFGHDLPAYEYTDLLLEFSVSSVKAQAHEDPSYYASKEIPSIGRLREMLEEAAFWSKYLLGKSADLYWMFLAAVFLISIFLIFGLLATASRGTLMTAAKLVSAVLTTLVSVDLVGAALAYAASAREVGSVLSKLRQAPEDGDALIQNTMILLTDYNSAVESAPLFAPGVYRRNRDKLNDMWAKREGLNIPADH
jgi:hypothetical protein